MEGKICEVMNLFRIWSRGFQGRPAFNKKLIDMRFASKKGEEAVTVGIEDREVQNILMNEVS